MGEEAGVSDCTANDERDICASIDPNNPAWWYLAPKGSQGQLHSMWFHIPSNVNCPDDRCTVQFTWKTANSCNPHPAAYCNYYHNVVGPQNTWCNIGIVADSAIITVTQLTIVKQLWAIACVAAKCSLIVPRSSSLEEPIPRNLRLRLRPLQLPLLRLRLLQLLRPLLLR